MDLRRYLILVVTLISMSISGPTIRFVAAPALAVVLWRVVLAWPVLAGTALLRRDKWPLVQGAAAGLFLSWHWVGWVLGVQQSSMASAAVLVSTGVLWAAVLSRPLLGEPISRRHWLGTLLAVAGVALVVTGRHEVLHSLRGDLFAFSSALAWVGYSFVGRRARQAAGFWGYTASVYLTATLTVLATGLLRGTRLGGFDERSWIAIVVLALFPTLLGHGGFNYLLRYLGPAKLGLWSLIEPVVATLLAWPLFGEVLHPETGIGVLVALVGVGCGVAEPPGALCQSKERAT